MEPWATVWIVAVLAVALITYANSRIMTDVYWTTGISTFIVGVVGGILMLMSYIGEQHDLNDNISAGDCEEYKTEQSIISIGATTGLAGSFVIGTGTIRSTMYYVSYVDTPRGLYLTKYSARNTYVVEQDGEPKAVSTNYTCPMPVYSWLRGTTWLAHKTDDHYILYVPKGTILREFKL